MNKTAGIVYISWFNNGDWLNNIISLVETLITISEEPYPPFIAVVDGIEKI